MGWGHSLLCFKTHPVALARQKDRPLLDLQEAALSGREVLTRVHTQPLPLIGSSVSGSCPPDEWPLPLSLAGKRVDHLDTGQTHSQSTTPGGPGCLEGWKAI